MESLFDKLQELIPVVIIVASFLLPAFLKKKKKENQKTPRRFGADDEKKRAGASLEDKVRRYFTELQGGKQAPEGRAGTPDETGPFLEPPPPSAAEPLPPPAKAPAPEPAVLPSTAAGKTLSSQPFTFDREALQFEHVASLDKKAEIDVYSVGDDAYDVREDAYDIFEDVHREEMEDAEEISGLISVGREGFIPSQRKPAGDRAAMKREDAPLIASLSGREIWKAVVLKEILDRPVGLKGFTTDLMW